MKKLLTQEEVRDLFRRYRAKGLSEAEELALRVAVQRFPELHDQLTEWDLLEEESFVFHKASIPGSSRLRSQVMGAWDEADQLAKEAKHFPIFHPGSTPADLLPLIPDEVLHPTQAYDNLLVQTLDRTEEATTLLIHLKHKLPPEVHSRLIEQFVIVQGQCYVDMDDGITTLNAGDYFRIPLTKTHSVTVTSEEPCVFICQRIPAA